MGRDPEDRCPHTSSWASSPLVPQPPSEVDAPVIPTSQVRKPRLKEIGLLAQGHGAGKTQRLGLLDS